MSTLFIGGTNDGERLDVEHQPFVELINKEDRDLASIRCEAKDVKYFALRREVYMRMEIPTQTAVFIIYHVAGMSENSVIVALLECYKKGGGA